MFYHHKLYVFIEINSELKNNISEGKDSAFRLHSPYISHKNRAFIKYLYLFLYLCL